MDAMNIDNSLSPHGGVLVDRVVTDKRKAASMINKCAGVLRIDGRTARTLVNIAYGFYSPLEGFMTRKDLEGVCRDKMLTSGYVWSLPVVCDIPEKAMTQLNPKIGSSILLEYHNIPFAVLDVEDIYTFDKDYMAVSLYEKENVDHPGIKQVHALGDYFLGGGIWMINRPRFERPYDHFFIPPHDLRERLKRRRWHRTLAYHSNTVPHMGHEWLMKSCWFQHHAKGILATCAVGSKRIGDCIDEALLLAHQELLNAGYFKENGYLTVMVLWDTWYAGAREAIVHAIMAKNLGCTGHIFPKNYAHPRGIRRHLGGPFRIEACPGTGHRAGQVPGLVLLRTLRRHHL